MSLAQQPPFLICVPIAHSANWPGLAAREIEALLDGLGNPANDALKEALDKTNVVHFLSLSVIWDEVSKDPPILVADVAADGPPWSVISALVEHAGPLLLAVYRAAAGVDDLDSLQLLLEAHWVSPVAASWPLQSHRATGLAFQGTPDLTLDRIRADAKIARDARAAVFGHPPQGPPEALTYLGAARTALGIADPRGEPFNYSDAAPSLAGAGVVAQGWTIFGLVVIDWSFLFVFLLSVFALNIHALIIPLASDTQEYTDKFVIYAIVGLILSVSIHLLTQSFRPSASRFFGLKPLSPLILLLVLFDALLAVFFFAPPDVRGWFGPVLKTLSRFNSPALLVLWMAVALSAVAVALFIAVVAAILVLLLRAAEKRNQPRDVDPEASLLAELMRKEDLRPHKQNHMIAVSTIAPGFFRRFVSLPVGLYVASLTVRAGVFRKGFLSGIGTIHFIQWACVPGTGKLVFTANYDGSFQSYLEDAITLLPGGATGIWSNANGFPSTRLLFLDGAKDGDRFKRWVRRQMIPTRFWYSAYPGLTATDIRLNAAIRLGLEAKDITPSEAEAWLKLFGSAPRPVSEVETDQIQGLALSGYRRLREGALLAVSFPADHAACRAWLAGVGARIAFGDTGQSQSAMAVALSARGLKGLGLAASDPLAAQFLPAFVMGMADEARANVLGDVEDNAPGKWIWGGPDKPVDAVLLVYAVDGTALKARLEAETAASAGAGMAKPHKIVLHQWPLPRDPDTNKPVPITEPFGFVDGISQPSIRGLLTSHDALKTDLLEPGEFILGYPDGRQQFPPTPQVFATDDPARLLPDLPAKFPPPPSSVDAKPGHVPALRDLGRNGSYLVIRQLKQNVDGFNNYLEQAAAKIGETTDWVAAKMIGRWRSGAPLALFPHGQPGPEDYDPIQKDEDFLFGRDDPQGLACPFGAHIRRANPRDQFDPDNKTQMSITNRHRILRRGRAYVDGDTSEADPQGLLFMCLNADIERQFEFLQQTWIGSTSFGPLRDENDPLTGLNRGGGTYTIPTLAGPKQLTGMPSFVSVIGGGYFFLPGRRALAYLSR